jgi:hypothetical protein
MKPINLCIADELGVREQQVAVESLRTFGS